MVPQPTGHEFKPRRKDSAQECACPGSTRGGVLERISTASTNTSRF